MFRRLRRLRLAVPTLLGLTSFWSLRCAHAEGQAPPDERFSLHFQETTVTQAHPDFHADYSGTNSLQAEGEVATSITSTLFAGARAWPGAELYVNPELSGGRGMSEARGVAGFPNGETFRVGSAEPVIYLGRLFLRQTIELGGARVWEEPDANQLGGSTSAERLTLTLGRFSLSDIFDDNAYSHDPRTQFLNWALMSSGGWDYPADTRGYTWGGAIEYTTSVWALRAAAVLVPRSANGLEMDTQVSKAHGLVLEGERQLQIAGRQGALRLLVFLNRARMGRYDTALETSLAEGTTPDITLSREPGRTKFGFAISADQELTPELGAFARLSWNDGQNETWAFTEIDHSLALGAVENGAAWGRAADELGLALLTQGVSGPHRRYLGAGGLGFILGDGALDYGLETALETYYRLALTEPIALSADYQLVFDPAYNQARGPVNAFALRLHVEL